MLTAFFEIIMAMLTVYGLYCLIINIAYAFFCGDKKDICIAFFKNEKNDALSNILLAKKAFMGRTRTVILIDFDLDDCKVKKISEKNPGIEIYRTERVKKVER